MHARFRDFLIFLGGLSIMVKKINHRGHGQLLFSLWFSDPVPEDNKNVHDLLRSAYTIDEKVVFRTVSTANVLGTSTYQVSIFKQMPDQ